MKKLLRADPLLAAARDEEGWTACLRAAFFDQDGSAAVLLRAGAPPNDVDLDSYGFGVLHWAAERNNVNMIISVAATKGADMNLKVSVGMDTGREAPVVAEAKTACGRCMTKPSCASLLIPGPLWVHAAAPCRPVGQPVRGDGAGGGGRGPPHGDRQGRDARVPGRRVPGHPLLPQGEHRHIHPCLPCAWHSCVA